MSFNKIMLDYNNREEIDLLIDSYPGEPEMTYFESAFLSGVIQKFKPKKIVEIGVAAGGTSVIILNALKNNSYKIKMWSIDLNEGFYRDSKLRSGFLISKYLEKSPSSVDHHLLTGRYAPEYIDLIGDEIDLLVIDTVHQVPGEILDFLAFFPFLAENAVVVLHDTVANHFTNTPRSYATKLLFDVISAEKYFNFLDNDIEFIPNIAAFKVTDQTKLNLIDVISSLSITWEYQISSKEKQIYSDILNRFYSTDEIIIWNKILNLNVKRKNLVSVDLKHKSFLYYLVSLRKVPIFFKNYGLIKTLKKISSKFI